MTRDAAAAARDARGMRLAQEARALGARGWKAGNDMGAVLLAAGTGELLAWGVARSLRAEPPRWEDRKRVKVDIHAEVDALGAAARAGKPTEGATCFVTCALFRAAGPRMGERLLEARRARVLGWA